MSFENFPYTLFNFSSLLFYILLPGRPVCPGTADVGERGVDHPRPESGLRLLQARLQLPDVGHQHRRPKLDQETPLQQRRFHLHQDKEVTFEG